MSSCDPVVRYYLWSVHAPPALLRVFLLFKGKPVTRKWMGVTFCAKGSLEMGKHHGNHLLVNLFQFEATVTIMMADDRVLHRTVANAKCRRHDLISSHLKSTFAKSESSYGGCDCVCVYDGNQRQVQSDRANMAAAAQAREGEEWKKASRKCSVFICPVMQIKISFP